MQRRKLWEKTLAWVLAVVCCLSIVNLAPVAQKASAAQPANTSAGTVHANMSEGYNYSSVQSKFEEDKENGIYYANAILYDYFNETQVAAYQNGTNKWTVSKTAFEQNDVKDSDLNWHYTGSWKIGQFETFNASLVRDYKFPGGQQSATSLIYHPLYVQAADNIVEWTQNNDWSWREAPGLQYIYSRAVSWGYLDSEPAANTNGGANLWEWRLNHGLDGQTGSGDLSHASVQGIVNSKLGPNGELLSNNDGARSNGNLVVMPQFDAEYLESAKIGTTYGSLADPLGFPFRKDTTREGYYVYNSSVDGTGYNDNAYLVNNDGNYSLSYVRSNSASDRVLDVNNNPGYFPFNDKGQSYNTNGRHVINYGFGTRMDIPFKIPSNSSEDIVFHFSGDDDLWVFVDGELALDLGGAHAKSEGTINFSTGVATANQAISGAGSADVGAKTLNLSASQTSTSTQHVMTIYYMERGLYESNLMVEFNFVPISQVNGLTVSNDVIFDNINSGFLSGISSTDFQFTYSIYDVDEPEIMLYENDTLTLPKNGAMSATSSLEQEVDGGTMRGDRMNVTQGVNNAFTTSWELKNTAGNTIYTSANSGNPYNVIDGNTGVYFRLDDNVAADAPLNLTAAFRNVAKGVNLVIDKTDTSASSTDATTYRFKVLYSKVLGVNKTGSFSGEYTITDTRTGTTSTAITDSEGNITIHRYETATISGVPAYSTINVFEVDNGNYKRTNISTGTTLTNNAGYFDIEDAASYTCEVVNGDADPDVYYAEVGTPIVVNNGDELSFPTKELPLADNTPVPFTWTVHHDAGTQDVTKASGSVSLGNNWQYHDTDINLNLPAGDYFIRLKGNHAGAIILSLLQINGDGKYILDNVPGYWTEGTVSIQAIGPSNNEDTYGWYDAHQAVFSFGNGTNEGAVVYPINVNSNFTKLTVRAATWTDYNLEYEIFQRETTPAYDEEIQMVTDGRNYDYFEKISGIGNVSPNATVSYDDNSIRYEYNGAPGVDTFYYTLERYIVGGYSYEGRTVIPETRSISTKTVPVTVYNYQLTDNTFVVDYGLPIDTSSILSDDTLSIAGASTTTTNLGVSITANTHSGTESMYTPGAAGVPAGAKADVTYGRATYASNAYKYIPEKFLDAVDTFYYAEQVVANGAAAPYNAAKATPVMTAAVNIIPANVVYYEDNFSYYSDKTNTERAITYSANAPAVVDSTGLVTQSNSLEGVYGFDAAYENQYADSLGHAAALGNGTQVQFTFKGTGVDIISRTDSGSAAVLYGVYNASGAAVKFGMLDTKYT
ncbi:MAG: fibro-slime domain-containing protein, partial [Lachnospiraceae bacterium]|nr:fibro-slime domain-containing protein [Lachnospiraceae bacterium]